MILRKVPFFTVKVPSYSLTMGEGWNNLACASVNSKSNEKMKKDSVCCCEVKDLNASIMIGA